MIMKIFKKNSIDNSTDISNRKWVIHIYIFLSSLFGSVSGLLLCFSIFLFDAPSSSERIDLRIIVLLILGSFLYGYIYSWIIKREQTINMKKIHIGFWFYVIYILSSATFIYLTLD